MKRDIKNNQQFTCIAWQEIKTKTVDCLDCKNFKPAVFKDENNLLSFWNLFFWFMRCFD